MYIHTHVYMCVYVCVYIYIYIHTWQGRLAPAAVMRPACVREAAGADSSESRFLGRAFQHFFYTKSPPL